MRFKPVMIVYNWMFPPPPPPPSYGQLVKEQLEAAKRRLLEVKAEKELQSALESALIQRVSRLQKEMEAMTPTLHSLHDLRVEPRTTHG